MTYVLAFFGAVAFIAGMSQLVWAWHKSTLPNPPHWEEAFRYVWCDFYEMDWETRPRVIFVWGRSFLHNGEQVTGLSDHNAITVAVEFPHTKLSDTAFHHELWHQARARKGLPLDPDHRALDWVAGGVVDRARIALKVKGW